MKIRDRLSLYFTLISIVILLIVMVSIYTTFKSISQSDFFGRLKERTMAAAGLYLEADEVSQDSLVTIRENYLEKVPGEVIRIYNSRNKATFIPDNHQYWPNSIVEEVRKKGYLQYIDGRRQTVGIYYKDNQGDFVILASAVDETTDTRMHNLLEIMSLVFLVIILLCFLTGRWLAQRMLSPISKVISRMQVIRANSLDMRVDEGPWNDEISLLARNFNNLLEHLENAFELQKTFVVNASHELRTPVTSIIGESEIALTHERTPDEYKQVLRSVLFDSERLNNTITGLLELAEVDMDFSRATLVKVRMDELLWELADYWNNKLSVNSFQLDMNLPDDEDQLTITCNRSLMFIAVNNIIANAFKFSENKIVTCSLSINEYHLSIKITDTGVGISTEDIDKIFTPFYRASNASEFQGNGLGLYIASKIVSLYKGKLSVSSNKGIGTCCSIDFSVF